jgi:CxxC motif-containing protein (DUF1111 family)
MRPSSSRRGWALRRFAPLVLAATGLLGCTDDEVAGPADGAIAALTDGGAVSSDAGPPDLFTEIENPETDQPLVGLPRAALDVFHEGDRLFGRSFRPADGLGPLYIRPSCAACHQGAGSGPGLVEKFQIVDPTTRLPIKDAPELSLGVTERPFTVAGATQPLLAPANPLPGHELVHSRRIGPTVMGRGYIEAVLDSEIERVAAEQAARTDGIHGRINRVTYHSQAIAGVAVPHEYGQTNVIGRFGVKARVATLDDFAADAFQGDMGLTSPMRPAELPNPDGLPDDDKPGPDLTAELVTTVAAYVRTIEIPSRAGAASTAAGAAAFVAADCAVCHATGLNTRPDFPVPQLAGIYAPLYSDLLLHDMGDDLADRQTDESAGPRDWRTAPLMALRYQSAYLHDGRAATIEVAILKHAGAGSEANGSVAKFKALSPDQRAALLAFVQGL